MAIAVVDDRMLREPRLLVPKMAPVGKCKLSQTARSLGIRAVAIPVGGGVETISDVGPIPSRITGPTESGIDVAGGSHGLCVKSTTQHIKSFRLEPTPNLSATESVWRSVVGTSACTAVVVFRRTGAAKGNAPLFGINDPLTSPYAAYNFKDNNGEGTLTAEIGTSSGYSYVSAPSYSILNTDLHVALLVYDGSNLFLNLDGTRLSTAVTGNITAPNSSSCGCVIGNFWNYTGDNRSFIGEIYMCALGNKALSVAEQSSLIKDPYQFLIPA